MVSSVKAMVLSYIVAGRSGELGNTRWSVVAEDVCVCVSGTADLEINGC